MMELMHGALVHITDVAILLFEFMGVLIVIVTGIKAAINYVRRNPATRLNLAKGLAMGLEFKLGSEILRTVVVRDFTEIANVAGIIVLRAALTLLIHWEIKNEQTLDEVSHSKHDL